MTSNLEAEVAAVDVSCEGRIAISSAGGIHASIKLSFTMTG